MIVSYPDHRRCNRGIGRTANCLRSRRLHTADCGSQFVPGLFAGWLREEGWSVTGSRGPADELAGAFARMSGVLLTEATVASALFTVTCLAGKAIFGSTGSGVALIDAEGRRTTSAGPRPSISARPSSASWRSGR